MRTMRLIKILMLSITFLSFSQAQASFGEKVLDHVENFNFLFWNPYVASIRSGSISEPTGFEKHGVVEYPKVKVQGLKRPLKLRILLNSKTASRRLRNSRNDRLRVEHEIIPSPLFVFIPGLFGALNSVHNEMFQKTLVKKGFHVLVFPNPLSVDFLSSGPTQAPGNPIHDASMIYEGISRVAKMLNEQNYIKGDIHLAGVSHGAFMSSILAARDQMKVRPLISGDVTLIAPPFNLADGLKRLDIAIDDTKDEARGTSFGSAVMLGMKIKRAKVESDLDQDTREKAKMIVVQFGFKRKLKKSVYALRTFMGMTSIPSHKEDKKAFEKWSDELNFGKYMELHAPEVRRALTPQNSSLSYWMNRYRKKSNKQMRVLTAEDDFLNSPHDWDSFPSDQVIILPRGGHFGYRTDKWFARFMKLAF